MRCFIALPIKRDTCIFLQNCAIQLQPLPWAEQVKWFSANNYHLTLQFIGSKIAPEKVEQIMAEMSNWLTTFPAFDIKIKGIELFPNQTSPHTVIAAIENNKTLTKLVGLIADRLSAIGLQPSQQSFRPHISLGRINSKADISLIQIPPKLTGFDFGLRVDTITLYQSELTQKAPIYTELKTIYLD